MVNKRNLLKILAVKNDRYIATYLTRVLDNLENVGNQEQRYSIWAIVVVFFYLSFWRTRRSRRSALHPSVLPT